MTNQPQRPALRYDNAFLGVNDPSWLQYPNMKRRSAHSGQRMRHYQCVSDLAFSLNAFSTTENLRAAYGLLDSYGGDAAGVDKVTFDDLSPVEVFPVLRRYSEALRSKQYRPRPTLPVSFDKPTGGTRELALHCIGDRTVAKALTVAIKPFIGPHVPLLTESVPQLFKNLEAAVREHQTYVLATDDVRKCFDEVRVEDVLGCFDEVISQPDLRWLIETVVRGHAGPERLVGLDQGSPFSPTAIELMLQKKLDLPLDREQAGTTSRFRYVDNVLCLSHDAQSGLSVLARMNEILSGYHMVLKGKDGPPFDLRDLSHGRTVLGFEPYWVNNRLDLRVPTKVFGKLRQKLLEVAGHSDAHQHAFSLVLGFIHCHGPCLSEEHVTDFRERLVSALWDTGYWEIDGNRLDTAIAESYQAWADMPVSSPFSPWVTRTS